MNHCYRTILFMLLMSLPSALCYGTADALSVHTIQVKATERYEDLLRKALASYFRNEAYLLSVKVKLDSQKIDSAKNLTNAAKADAEEAHLPDLPIAFNEKDFGKLITDTMSLSELDQYIESVSVRLTIDESYGDKAKDILTRTIQEVIDPDGRRKDQITVERAQLHPDALSKVAAPSEPSETDVEKVYRLFNAHQNLVAVLVLGFFLMMGLWMLGRQVASRPSSAPSAGAASAPAEMAAAVASQSFGAATPTAAASTPAVVAATANTAAAKGAQEQIRKVAQERPHHAASVVRGFLSTGASRQAIVQFLQELPLDAAKAVVSHMSPREAALLVNGIGDRDGAAPAADVAEAMSRMQAALLAQELSPASAQWDFLGMLTEEDLKELVQEEDTEGKALVLFHLPASRASQVYGILSEEEKGSVIASLFDLESRNAEETEPARDRIKTRAAQLIQKPVTAVADAVGWITNVGPRLNESDRGAMIAGTDPARRAQVRASLFCFGDAGVLPNEILLMVLQGFRPAELAQLCASLEDGSPLLKRILETLPKQVQEIVVDEAAAQKQAAARPGAGRRFQVEITRLKTRFEQAVKALDAAGDISLEQLFMETGGSVTDINAISPEAEGADDEERAAA